MVLKQRSGFGSAFCIASAVVIGGSAAFSPSARAVSLETVQLGLLGDSYTFPYEFRSSRNDHVNWSVQIDNFYNGLDILGPVTPGNPPAYNVAESGWTTQQMATDEIANLGGDVVEPEVFVLFAGVNDFSGAFTVANGGSNISLNDIPNVADTALANIQATVSNILDERESRSPGLAEPDFVIINTIDRGRWPLLDAGIGTAQSQAAYDAVTAATEDLNANLTDWALSQKIPVVDAYGLLNLGNVLHEDGGTLTLGGQAIAAGTTSNDQPGNSWYADAAHAGTIYHGLLANAVLQAIEQRHGLTSPGLDFHDDILAAAYDQNDWPGQGSGVSLNDYLESLDETQYEIDGQAFDFDLNDYIAAFLQGDLDDDGLVTEDDILAFILAIQDPDAYTSTYGFAPTATADFNDDGLFNLADIEGFTTQLNASGIANTQALTALVPEPTAAVFVLMMAPALIRRR